MKMKSDMITVINVVTADTCVFKEGESCLVVPAYHKEFPLNSAVLLEEDEMTLQALADKEVITGKSKSCYYLPTPSKGYKGVLVLGLGERESLDAETMRRAAGAAVSKFSSHRVCRLYVDVSSFPEVPVEAFVEGINLGQYVFDTYKQVDADAQPVLVTEITVIVGSAAVVAAVGDACQTSALLSLATNGARHLANTAANDMTPTALALAAGEIANADNSQCTCTVFEQEKMAELGMNALLGVAQGGVESPKLIFLEYRHPDAKRTVALVGKGVTFDSGGISLKPGSKMH
ncbi:MAG: hypothetical protein KAH38_03390, partial [Candidatus Hydrogenedentes bacterium]|nr:hypothetical protein [Candidatus Hydrogenedentota bacterium]